MELSSNVVVIISQEKIKDDEKWDGLKGYVTNTDLSAQEVYRQYSNLWSIERAFRITKGTIEVRPMFHFTERRIEPMYVYVLWLIRYTRSLNRILKLNDVGLSVDKVLAIAKTVTTIKIKLPISGQTMHKTMFLTESHKAIAFLFDDDFWENHLG